MIIIDQYPTEPFDQAYGPNAVTVKGLPTDPVTGAFTAQKYVLQIWRSGVMIADFRQSPNASAVAIFDIQNTLQNYVSTSKDNIEETGYIGTDLANSEYESTPYIIRASFEQDGIVPPYPGDPGEWDETPPLLDFGGRKDYYEVFYPTDPLVPALVTGPGPTNCTTVTRIGQPLTERKTGRRAIDIFNAGEGIPGFLATNTVKVIEQNVTVDDMTTTSFINKLENTNVNLAKSIEAYVFYQYNGPVLISTDIVYNVQGNGGGPNTVPAQGTIVDYPYYAITAATGPKNFQDFDPTATHYYVIAQPWGNNSCPSQFPNLQDESLFNPMRFNIVDGNCSDFPNIQFSWLNEYGFRDYWTFNKRNNRDINIKRNTYLEEAADYASTSYDVNVYNRGTTVYSQSLQETFSAFTDYISDEEALFLEGLFISADVKVRFDGKAGAAQYQWVPVALLSSNYNEKTVRKNKLFQYEIKFKRAHNLKSQRG